MEGACFSSSVYASLAFAAERASGSMCTMTKRRPTTFYCFSPPVMLATFIIEIAGAVYVLVRFGTATIARLAALILVNLAVFQLAEWNVCEGSFGVSADTWAKLGYVSITLLPALGFHFATKLAGTTRWRSIVLPYIAAGCFAVLFLAVEHGIKGSVCLGNYVLFELDRQLVSWYTLYYYGMLLIGVMYSFKMARAAEMSESRKRALKGLGVGYCAFIIPSTAVAIANPGVIHGMPSIMCGFAVLLALCIIWWVVPAAYERPGTGKK